jgi:Antitoxin-like ribbon-helix-helix
MAMKTKPVNQMNLEELKAAEALYSKRTDHPAKLMLVRIREALAVQSAAAPAGNGNYVPPSRAGRVMIGTHFLPAVQRELKILAAQEGVTLGQLLREALSDLLVKRGRPSVDTLEAKN